MRCLSCKYDLSHLTERRCPECGRAFDPNDPKTFVSPISRRLKLRRYAFQILISGLLSFIITYASVFYLEASSPSTSPLDSAPAHAHILANTLANWPFAFAFLLIAFMYVLPRLVKRS